MGIPGLIPRLQPFSSVERLRDDIIIDGPAFAYHVYRLSERDSIPSDSPLDQISYKDLGVKAIAWLSSLESCHVTM